MSDSDSSDDETNAQLLSAVDTSFLNDNLYKPTAKKEEAKKPNKEVKSSPVPAESVSKSNRFLPEEESIFHSELNVPAAVQKYAAEKLSRLISTIIEFDETERTPQSLVTNGSTEEVGVRLLPGCDEIIDINLDPTCPAEVKLKKVPIVRRAVEKEAKLPMADKIAASVCDPGTFPSEVQQWKGPRKRSIEFKYNQKQNGTIVEKSDPFANEFTKARNANMWHESKIRRFKKRA
uniref:Uncharacterized protein n=1 Tax=Anopheles melas TaxID=34690 RepID=A0A182TLX8_9DIPT